MSFKKIFEQYEWDEVGERIYSSSEAEVIHALSKKGQANPEDFMAMVSPAASGLLEEMAQQSHHLTQKRFGKTIQLYSPLYLSNECQNICTYCGFSFNNKIPRVILTDEQIMQEVAVIKSYGYDHILLVTGEASKAVGISYFEHVLELIRPHFAQISLEVQPLNTNEYERLTKHALNTVLVYQETYHQENYKLYHTKGKKSNFDYRLETPDRIGSVGVHKIGLGTLLGLEDWRIDSFFTALHLHYLKRAYWQTKYSISFPRLRPAEGSQQPKHPLTDKDLVQLICAFRIFDENVELSLSTRESPQFRDHVYKLGITTMSAGSKTNPGGYSLPEHSLEQFEISDERSPQEVAGMILQGGYQPVWKDWDAAIMQ